MPKVLIVDDEESIRFSFSSILKDEGYEVVSAEHPIDARSIMNVNRFDVAVIDRLLTTENGMNMVEFINDTQPMCTTILMSAYPNFKSAAEGFSHNLFAYLQKPVKKNELCTIVAKASVKSLEKQRANQYEQERIHLQRMANMDMICGGLIHDYNNILMPVMGLAQLACLDLAPENSRAGQLDKLIASNKQIQGVSSILMSYLQADNNELNTINIKTLFEDALTILQMIIPKTITIEKKILIADCYSHANKMQIQQVIINLGVTAMKSMEGNAKKIEFCIEVAHPGPVMPEPLKDNNRNYIKITIKGGQCGVDNESDKTMLLLNQTDLGIGASVSCEIIKNHGGIIIDEHQRGAGSGFCIFLPLSEN